MISGAVLGIFQRQGQRPLSARCGFKPLVNVQTIWHKSSGRMGAVHAPFTAWGQASLYPAPTATIAARPECNGRLIVSAFERGCRPAPPRSVPRRVPTGFLVHSWSRCDSTSTCFARVLCPVLFPAVAASDCSVPTNCPTRRTILRNSALKFASGRWFGPAPDAGSGQKSDATQPPPPVQRRQSHQRGTGPARHIGPRKKN